MTNSYWILGLRAGSSEAVFWRWDALPKGEAAVLSAPWKHTSPEEGSRAGFVWSKEGLEGYHAEEVVFSAFFSSDSGTTNARG